MDDNNHISYTYVDLYLYLDETYPKLYNYIYKNLDNNMSFNDFLRNIRVDEELIEGRPYTYKEIRKFIVKNKHLHDLWML